MASKIREYKQEMNEAVSKEIMAIRIPHTKATSECAMSIADRVGGINKFDLHAACVLHDIAKELSYETMVKIIINGMKNPLLAEVIGDISISEYESPKWLHGIVGAIVAHDIYGIKSKDVLKAIRYHKVGNTNDPIFTKILITADVANALRQARYMVAAYTTLKMRKFDPESVYQNIIKYDTMVAVTQEDVVIPRMIQGSSFKINKITKCPVLGRIGDYYDEDLEYIWVPNPTEDGWKRVGVDGVYVTPDGFENARTVMDSITHDKPKEVVLTLSERDWGSYMLSFIDDENVNRHIVIPFADANNSGLKLPRGFYPKTPTRYFTIDPGEFV